MLTAQQAQLLKVLEDASDEGRSMSYQAMLEPLGVVSRGNVQRVVASLIARGFLEWTTGPRRLKVIRRASTIFSGRPASDDPIVAYIHQYQCLNGGASPSVRQIRERFGLSFNGVQSRLNALDRTGAIIRTDETLTAKTSKKAKRFIYVPKATED